MLSGISRPHLRGVNTNLSLFTMDGGYFLSPYVGGILLAAGCSAADLFYASAGVAMLAALLLLALRDGPVQATASEPGPMSQ